MPAKVLLDSTLSIVMPANAGIQRLVAETLDSRLRGNDNTGESDSV
jgi:hypothetical protein